MLRLTVGALSAFLLPSVAALTALVVACTDDEPAPAEPIAVQSDAGVDTGITPEPEAAPAAAGVGLVGLGRVDSQTILALSPDRTRVFGWGANLNNAFRTADSVHTSPINMNIPGVPTEPFRFVAATGTKTCLLTEQRDRRPPAAHARATHPVRPRTTDSKGACAAGGA